MKKNTLTCLLLHKFMFSFQINKTEDLSIFEEKSL